MSLLDKISGTQAYEFMLLRNEYETKVRNFFYDAEIWKAIRNHIESDKCSIILKENPIIVHRGTGQAICIGKCHTYHTQYEQDPQTFQTISFPAPNFNMSVNITYWDEEYERQYDKEYNIQVPIGLLTDFSENKFNAWVKIKSVETLKETKDNLVRETRKLLKNLPAPLAKSILKKINSEII